MYTSMVDICMYVYVIRDRVFVSQTAFAFCFDFKYFRPAPAVFTSFITFFTLFFIYAQLYFVNLNMHLPRLSVLTLFRSMCFWNRNNLRSTLDCICFQGGWLRLGKVKGRRGGVSAACGRCPLGRKLIDCMPHTVLKYAIHCPIITFSIIQRVHYTHVIVRSSF